MPEFDNGQAVRVVLIDETKATRGAWGVEPAALAAALQFYVSDVAASWPGCDAKVVLAPPGTALLPTDWALVFLDDADQAAALGYHDLTSHGEPMGKVFVRTTLQDGEIVSVTASHELAEMLVDPAVQMGAQHLDGAFWAYEIADAVEAQVYHLNQIPVSNFVTPAYFEAFRARKKGGKFDHLGKLTHPFQIPEGGYMSVFRAGKWTQLSSHEHALRKTHRNHGGRRVERRMKMMPPRLSRHQ